MKYFISLPVGSCHVISYFLAQRQRGDLEAGDCSARFHSVAPLSSLIWYLSKEVNIFQSAISKPSSYWLRSCCFTVNNQEGYLQSQHILPNDQCMHDLIRISACLSLLAISSKHRFVEVDDVT